MSVEAEVWVIERERKILVQTPPAGPPANVCVIDEKAAKARGYIAIGDVHFPKDALLGCWPMPEFGWGKAGEVAQQKAKELGYEIEYVDLFMPRYAEDCT